jgi:NAD(P)-dependent dehydrogenase (short-subunit alcohol dehydrogenase family)
VEAMADALALETWPLGIRVVKIRPGAVNTNFDEVALAELAKVDTSPDYQPMIDRLKQYQTTVMPKAEGPGATADIIVEAIEAKEPRVAYQTTADAIKSIADEESMSEEEIRRKRLGL